MEDQIIKKLQDHDQRFDSVDNRIDLLAITVVDIQGKLKEHDDKFERVINTVVDIQEQVNEIKETMVTKTDMAKISNTLDVIVGLHKKTDQELTFMGERMKRVEENTKINTEDIRRIKPLVGLKTA